MKLSEVIHVEINRGKKQGVLRTLYSIYVTPSKRVLLLYRVAKFLYDNGHKKMAVLFKNKLTIKYGILISLKAEIGLGLDIRHINGIVIGDGVSIGKNAIIYQQVTLGGKVIGDGKLGNYPKIGDNVTIFAGAKILGKIKIGNDSTIGANSVVTKNVPEKSIFAGIPAKLIKK